MRAAPHRQPGGERHETHILDPRPGPERDHHASGCSDSDDNGARRDGSNARRDGGAARRDATTARADASRGDAATTALTDPAPNATAPGEQRCAGCPDSNETTFAISATQTARTFGGVVTGATGDGQFYVVNEAGQAASGTVPTHGDSGQYGVALPLFCGAQLVKLVWTNSAGALALVYNVTTTGCVEADLRLTLTWDEVGDDWELHLIKPGGRINDNATDCTWTSCITSSPDWGVVGDATDDPKKDVDNTGAFGPENIFFSKPENGVYTVLVEHWGGGEPTSDGQLVINLKGRAPVVLKKQNLVSGHVWTAATITWPGGVVTPSQTDYDCTGNWSGGCKAVLP
ncbi:MAG: hypothetical protein IPG96_15295 [Proteobacteria bacterium]|nr:hypothetical protein [Pseudomonadota bacterium]